MTEYTVKDLADLMQVSKTTVRRVITEKGITPVKTDTQKRYYSADDSAAICAEIKPDMAFPDRAEPQQETETPRQETAIPQQENRNTATQDCNTATETAPNCNTDRNTTETPQQISECEFLRSEILRLHDEIKQQRDSYEHQLSEKDRQYSELMERLSVQQALSAADKQMLLDAKKTPSEADQDDTGDTVEAATDSTADQMLAGKRSLWSIFRRHRE